MTRSERLRSVFAAILVVLGAITLMFASTGWWLERYFLDTERFTTTVDEVLDREEVKLALSEEIVREINRETGRDLNLIKPVISSIVGQVVDSSAFRKVFNAAVSTAHRALVDQEVPEVTLDLEDTYNDIRSAIRAVSPRIANDMPKSIDIDVDVLDRSQLETVWDIIDVVEDVILYLTLGAVVLIAGGLALSPRRWRTFALAGYAALGTFTVLLLALAIARRITLDQIGDSTFRDAAGAAWDVVTHGLVVQTIALLVITGIVGLVAGWTGRHGGLAGARDLVVSTYARLREALPSLAPAPEAPAPAPGTAATAATAATADARVGAPETVGAAVGTVMARFRLPEPAENRRARHVWRAIGLAALAAIAFVWPNALTTMILLAVGFLALYLAVIEGLAALASPRAAPAPAPAPHAPGR
jgi:hypothetical protein